MKLLDWNTRLTDEYVELILHIAPYNIREVDSTRGLVGRDIEIRAKKEKRSINANSYYWSLINGIASAVKLSSTEVHNKMLSDYGAEWIDENGNRTWVLLPIDTQYQKEETLHLKPTSRTSVNNKGEWYRAFILMKPSHMYDTKEFSRLLDGAIQEARQLGIEIRSDEWVQQIKESWGM